MSYFGAYARAWCAMPERGAALFPEMYSSYFGAVVLNRAFPVCHAGVGRQCAQSGVSVPCLAIVRDTERGCDMTGEGAPHGGRVWVPSWDAGRV